MIPESENRYLLVGPLLNAQGTNVGGATVSFTDMIDFFRTNGRAISVIDTQKYGGFFGFMNVMISSFFRVMRADILFLNLSQRGVKYLAPPLCLMGRILRRKVIVRPFGGWIIDQYQSYSSFSKWLFKETLAHSDIIYFQTKAALDFFQFVDKAVQLPTCRRNGQIKSTSFRKKFVYVGHVKASKGISEILKARESLDSSYQLDIYGPIVEKEYEFLKNKEYYKGQVGSNEITNLLREYDVLVFPSYYEGEGYPGAIIEAYSIGMPVIAARWMAIPEIVKNGVTGYLIKPENADQLTEAIEKFDLENFAKLKLNVRKEFKENFDRQTVLSRVMQQCESISI